MPITKSAIKKTRIDKKRSAFRKQRKAILKTSIVLAVKNKEKADIKKAISLVDKAVKNNLIHKNKAARLKSSLSKLTKK